MNNKKLLKGQIAFVTGASRGIGEAVAELFASEGADLILHCRSFNKEEKALKAKLKRKYGVKVEFFTADFAFCSFCNAVFRFLRRTKTW